MSRASTVVDAASESRQNRLGDLVRTARERAGLSLRAAEKATGVSLGYLHKIEHGRVDPSAKVLRSVAAGLQVPFEQLSRASAGIQEPADAVGGQRGFPGRDLPATAKTVLQGALEQEGYSINRGLDPGGENPWLPGPGLVLNWDFRWDQPMILVFRPVDIYGNAEERAKFRAAKWHERGAVYMELDPATCADAPDLAVEEINRCVSQLRRQGRLPWGTR